MRPDKTLQQTNHITQPSPARFVRRILLLNETAPREVGKGWRSILANNTTP